MKRSYIASVTLEYIIVVDADTSEHNLQVLGHRTFRDDLTNVTPGEFKIGPMTHIPACLGFDDLVYHDGPGDITVEEASKLPGGYAHGK